MSKEFLSERERGLENEFFYRVDQELKQKLRQQMQAEKNRERLATETGITDEGVLNELVEAGITPETLMALSLVPLVQVAWADRVMDQREREAVLRAAAEKGRDPDSPGYQLLNEWLQHPPGEKVFQCWKEYVQALCRTMDSEQVDSLRQDVVGHAREVAESVGGFLGFGAISKAEQAVLDELEQAFAR